MMRNKGRSDLNLVQYDGGLMFLRALATLLVLVGHVIQFTDPGFDNSCLFRLIYSFHMPLFMCLSGFLAPPKPVNGFLRRKAVQLLVPFVFWSLLLGLQKNVAYSSGRLYFLDFADVFRFLYQPDAGLWFLWVLFLLFAFHTFVLQRNRMFYGVFLIIFLSLLQFCVPVSGFFGLSLFRWHLAFFILGGVFSDYCRQGFPLPILVVAMIVAFVVLPVWHRLEVSDVYGFVLNGRYWVKVSTLLIQYFAAFSLLVICFGFRPLLKFQFSFVEFLARNSLPIYVLQFFVFALLRGSFSFGGRLGQFALFFWVLLICCGLVLILRRYGFVNRYLFGGASRATSLRPAN